MTESKPMKQLEDYVKEYYKYSIEPEEIKWLKDALTSYSNDRILEAMEIMGNGMRHIYLEIPQWENINKALFSLLTPETNDSKVEQTKTETA